MKRLAMLPELNVAFFSFLLNFAWEVLQTPFYVDRSAEINTIIWYRLHCTFGDVLITLGCFWLVALVFKKRTWFLNLTWKKLFLFVVFGVSYTLFSEITNVRLVESWGYSGLMPMIPGLGVGMMPLLQWIVVPILLFLIVRRQLS
jgi:hypothetical protein